MPWYAFFRLAPVVNALLVMLRSMMMMMMTMMLMMMLLFSCSFPCDDVDDKNHSVVLYVLLLAWPSCSGFPPADPHSDESPFSAYFIIISYLLMIMLSPLRCNLPLFLCLCVLASIRFCFPVAIVLFDGVPWRGFYNNA